MVFCGGRVGELRWWARQGGRTVTLVSRSVAASSFYLAPPSTHPAGPGGAGGPPAFVAGYSRVVGADGADGADVCPKRVLVAVVSMTPMLRGTKPLAR